MAINSTDTILVILVNIGYFIVHIDIMLYKHKIIEFTMMFSEELFYINKYSTV